MMRVTSGNPREEGQGKVSRASFILRGGAGFLPLTTTLSLYNQDSHLKHPMGQASLLPASIEEEKGVRGPSLYCSPLVLYFLVGFGGGVMGLRL